MPCTSTRGRCPFRKWSGTSIDQGERLQAGVREAFSRGNPLRIQGGGSKPFFGRKTEACTVLDLSAHQGIAAYEPQELFVTARAGTPLAVLEAVLRESGQFLPFEPPHWGPGATLGGTLACGLSGPARAHAGAARDFVLGVRMLNGQGQLLRFGGQVMKNVAGYDVPRLLVGSLGTLGVLLEATLKVLPAPRASRTRRLELDAAAALRFCRRLAAQPLPVSATCHDGKKSLFVRFSGNGSAVRAAVARTGGDALEETEAEALWRTVREQEHPFFAGGEPLWRLSLPPAAPLLLPEYPGLVEWGGAQRWLRGNPGVTRVQEAAAAHGGHAVLFRGDPGGMRFHPLSPVQLRLHQRLKAAFDPGSILNRGRMYPDF